MIIHIGYALTLKRYFLYGVFATTIVAREEGKSRTITNIYACMIMSYILSIILLQFIIHHLHNSIMSPER